MEESFLYYIEHSIKIHWNRQALTDYKGATHTYKDVARTIEELHILIEKGGIRKGDRIALCSRNMSNWGIAFLAILSFGAVAVPILHEFKPDNIHHIINHSEARILFIGASIWKELNHTNMPQLETVIQLEDYTILHNTTCKSVRSRLDLVNFSDKNTQTASLLTMFITNRINPNN